MGLQVLQNFLQPPAGSGEKGVTVVMDQVIRQEDIVFLNLIECMRRGLMTEDEVILLLSRLISKLPPEERV